MDTSSDQEPDVRVLEELHRVATDSLHRKLASYTAAEAKVGRHLTLVGLFLGVLALSLPEALEAYESASGLLQCAFALAYLAVVGSAIAALFCFLNALRWEVLWVDPVGRDFYEANVERTYPELLVALTKGAVDTYWKNQPVFDRKEEWAGRGFKATVATLASTVASVALYVVLRLAN